jgi:hypothetical protein
MERSPLGSAVDVLDGSVASAWSALDGNTAGSPYLPPSVPGNALENPTFDVAETNPPTGEAFNGDLYFDNWRHLGQLFIHDADFKTYAGTFYLADFPAFKDLGGENLGDQPKVISLYGSGSNFPDNTGDKVNTSNNRTYPGVPLCGFSETAPAGTFPDSGAWCRHEWSQGVAVPDSATKVTFGAYIRTPADDLFRDLNCGGVYIWQDINSAPPTNVYINAIVVKKPTDTISLVTGTQSVGLNSQQQWSGLEDSGGALRWNDTVNIQSIDYKSTNDHQQFRKVEKEVTLQSGTGRRIGLSMFFGENQGNLDNAEPPINTGSIQFYNPFLIFE